MKTTLPLHRLLRTFFLCLFCCASISVLAQDDDDKNKDPQYNPPKLPSAGMAAVYTSSVNFTVVFLEEADDVEVEVCNADGATVSVAVGTVDSHSRLQLDSRSWKRGTYTLRLKVKGKPVSVNSVRLQ